MPRRWPGWAGWIRSCSTRSSIGAKRHRWTSNLIRARDAVVRARSALINHVRGSVKSFGARIPTSSAEGFAAKAEEHLPQPLRAGLEPVLETIRGVTGQIRFFDMRIEALCEERYPETGVLRQIKGVGPITALTYRLVLEEPARFPRSRAVGAYLGLTRRHDDSGESEPELRITKAGDAFLRRCPVQAAHYILGRLAPIPTCAAGACTTSNVEEAPRRRRRTRRWRWPGSWPCCCTACGAPARSTRPCVSISRQPRRHRTRTLPDDKRNQRASSRMAATRRNPLHPTARSRGDWASFLRLTRLRGKPKPRLQRPDRADTYMHRARTCYRAPSECEWKHRVAGGSPSGVAAKSALTGLAFSWKERRGVTAMRPSQ